ncbi:MAG TPA: hypothetical protein VMB05_11385 [Solirubrobacteraceae bacterium]|nr:hypothetical protein [Solirubrobacteraceae bacterium]
MQSNVKDRSWGRTLRSVGARLYLVVLCGVVVTLAGCGSSRGHGVTVAVVEGSPITSHELDRWTSALAGTDFYENAAKKTNPNLVTDPPDLERCVGTVRKLVREAPTETANHSGHHVTSAVRDYQGQCQKLFAAVRHQALSFLIKYKWKVNEGREYGIVDSEQMLERQLRAIKAREPSEFALYLARRGLTVVEKGYGIRTNAINNRLIAMLESEHPSGGLYGALKVMVAREAGRKAKTSCAGEYVVPECSQYRHQGEQEGKSPSILVEEIACGCEAKKASGSGYYFPERESPVRIKAIRQEQGDAGS